MSIHLSVADGHVAPSALLERAALATLAAEGFERAEISVTLLPDRQMRALNAEWLGHDRVTDVLAFTLHDPGSRPIGDVYVGVEQAARQARDHGVSTEEELVRLVIHGTLHVLGYDHGEDGARDDTDMYLRQEALVRRVLAAADGAGGEWSRGTPA